MMKIRVSQKKIMALSFLVLFVVYTWAPCFTDSTLANDFTIIFAQILRYLLVVICIFAFVLNVRIANKRNIILLLSPVIYYILIRTDLYDITLTPNIIGTVAIILFLIVDDDVKVETYKYVRQMFIIVCAASIFVYIVSLLSLPFPHSVVDYYDRTVNPTFYYNYHISYVIKSVGMVRSCGIFNEPGFFATIGALILIIKQVDLKRKGNLIILFAMITAFSMAFFALILIYLALVSYKKRWPIVVLIVLLIAYLWLFPYLSSMDNAVGNLLSRFELINGIIVGNNRSTPQLDSLFESVLNGDRRAFGYGFGYWKSVMTWGTSSFKSYIVDFGLTGFILMYGSYLLTALMKSKKNAVVLALVICFFVSVYQRPNIFTFPYYVLLFGGISYLNKITTTNNNT